jgi:RNA polymerase sigma factor (sigma-70 family)
MNGSSSSTQVQRLLELLHCGHDSARAHLLEHGLERFRLLARRMLRRQQDLRALGETDDVVQHTLIRLHRALAQVKPTTARDFFGLAARQIRWVLRDFARKHAVAKCVTFPGHLALEDEPHDGAGEPTDLLEWADFHDKIDALPDEEREVFDLLLYQGMTQADAAALLGISLRSLKRRWQRARLRLRDALRGQWPSA